MLRRWPARLLLAVLASVVAILGVAAPADAHPLSTSAVLLDVETDAVTATVELPLDELSIARARVLTPTTVLQAGSLAGLRAYVQAHMTASDARHRAWSTSVTGGRVVKVDGVDNLVLDARLVPSSGPVGDFTLHYDAIVDRLVSHRVFVSGRYGHSGAYTTLAMLSWQTESVTVAAATPDATGGFVPAVELGVHHIAAGSDHLLFLIMLLLPAPLIAVGRRWRRRSDRGGPADLHRVTLRVVHVVTTFAIGHSCTLMLGALGLVDLPTRLVESGIALPVLISAVHAARPLVRRGEVLIASCFGLLHGLAFAQLLGSLELERTSLVSTLLGFNLGIELAQLTVVALVMPSVYLLSRTVAFPLFRILTATIGAALAAGWFADRVGLISGNPLEPVGDTIVNNPFGSALALAVVALTTYGVQRSVGGRIVRRRSAPSPNCTLARGPSAAGR